MLDKYDKDIENWNLLFSDYYSMDRFEEVSEVEDDKKLYSFLIYFEFYIRGLNDIRFNKCRNKHMYGEIDLQKNINGEIKGTCGLSANQFADTLDYILQQSSKVVQSFIFHGYLYKNNKFVYCSFDEEIDSYYIEKSGLYISLIDKRNVLFDLFEDWKFGDYTLARQDDENIKITPISMEKLINEKIEIQRFESSRYSTMLKGTTKIEAFSKLLPPSGYIDKQEMISYDEYLEYFSSDNLDYEVDEVEIKKWLRAYSVIRVINKEFIEKEIFPQSNKLEQWIYVSTSDEWVKNFIDYGIDEKSANIIFNRLKFDKSSIDWLDTPFIEVGDKILTVPSCATNIQDVLAIISLGTKDNMSLDFKGYCFESRVLNDLNKNKIPTVSLKRKVDGEEYQCDIAFVLEKDLFLCECKHTSQPATQRKRYDFYSRRLQEDVKQINRIWDFYSSNIGYVLEELKNQTEYEFEDGWKPRRTYRMLLYSCKLTGDMDIDGVIVTDYTIFTTFLNRKIPTITQNGKLVKQFMPPKMKGTLKGKLTTNKLLNFLENPWQVDFQKEHTKIEDENILINNMNIHRKKAVRTLDDFYDISK